MNKRVFGTSIGSTMNLPHQKKVLEERKQQEASIHQEEKDKRKVIRLKKQKKKLQNQVSELSKIRNDYLRNEKKLDKKYYKNEKKMDKIYDKIYIIQDELNRLDEPELFELAYFDVSEDSSLMPMNSENDTSSLLGMTLEDIMSI